MQSAIDMLNRHDIRHDLLVERGELLTRYHDALESADAELDAHEIDDTLSPEKQAEYWYAFVLSSMSDRDLSKLGEIIAALDRLDDGTYGICRTCGDDIEDWALAANHVAQRCPDCEVTAETPVALLRSIAPRHADRRSRM